MNGDQQPDETTKLRVKVNAEGSGSLKGVVIQVTSKGPTVTQQTDDNGEAVFTILHSDSVGIFLDKEGYESQHLNIDPSIDPEGTKQYWLKKKITEPEKSKSGKTDLVGILTALGGGSGIAAILALVLTTSSPSTEPQSNFSPVNSVQSDTTAENTVQTEERQVTGTWYGWDWGNIDFKQEGEKVFGRYYHNGETDGYMEGSWFDGRLNFRWWSTSTSDTSYESAELISVRMASKEVNKITSAKPVGGN